MAFFTFFVAFETFLLAHIKSKIFGILKNKVLLNLFEILIQKSK